MKYQEQVNPQRQNAEYRQRLHGERSKEQLFIGTGFSFEVKIVWNKQIDGGGGCIIFQMY